MSLRQRDIIMEILIYRPLITEVLVFSPLQAEDLSKVGAVLIDMILTIETLQQKVKKLEKKGRDNERN